MALGVVAFGIVVIFGKEAFAMKGAARRKMIVAFILMLEAIIFFRAVQPDANVTELLCDS